jgi:hypothetical protein
MEVEVAANVEDLNSTKGYRTIARHGYIVSNGKIIYVQIDYNNFCLSHSCVPSLVEMRASRQLMFWIWSNARNLKEWVYFFYISQWYIIFDGVEEMEVKVAANVRWN